MAKAIKIRDQVSCLQDQVEGWKRIAVIASCAMESIKISGADKDLHPEVQMSIDTAIFAISLAMSGKGVPPPGSYDDAVAYIRALMAEPPDLTAPSVCDESK